MRKRLGNALRVAGVLAWIGFGLWGLLLNIAVVSHVAGFWGVVVGFLVLPVTFFATPWYAGVALGDWLPLIVNYGGGIVGTTLIAVGSAMVGDDS